ncbi:MAG: GNAT family N-acetyltransferase [Acidobacteriia bacterium]|nr:GNAT family N-acetyltransferase [Terriglobia bacterium]
MIFKLRSYKPEDFETLYEIDQLCYEPAIAYSRRELRNYLSFPGADCVVAKAGAKIAGFIVTASADAWGYIVTIDVLEAYRRQRLGTLLLARAERRLAAKGVRQVALETATDNTAAIAFWQKHGYRTRGIRKDYYSGGRDAYSMVKRLNAGAKKARKGSEAL